MKGFDFPGCHIPVDHKSRSAKTSSSKLLDSLLKPAPVNVRVKPAKNRVEHKTENRAEPKAPPASPSLSAKKPLRYLATRSLLLACGLATLGNVPVYSMISSTEDGKLIHLTEPLLDSVSPAQVVKDLNLPAVAVESFSGYAIDILPDATQGNWSAHTVETDDTLESILGRLKLTKTSQKLLENTTLKQALGNLQADARLFTQVVDDSLQQLIYAKNKTDVYIVSVTDDGYVGKWETGALETRNAKIAFTIKHSIQKDGKTAGLSNSVIRQLSQVFQKDVDFKKGVKVGHKVAVIFEDFRYQGESIYTDKVLAAEYDTGKKSYQRVRFTLAEGRTDYFRPDGDTELKRTAFDRKPLADGRMTSGFGMRRHPVFGLRKNHAGVDFAAPRGTPIYATADGSVTFIGRQGGYGNVIELSHINGITTLYGHMSAFKDDLRSGQKVKRGDVIGYVGSTGTSTGNHVHYEFRVNGDPQNPMAVELPQVGIMTAEEMQTFKSIATAMVRDLTDLRKLASADQADRQQNGG